MAIVGISFRLGRFFDPFGPAAKRVAAPFLGSVGQSVIRAIRASIAREFRQGGWSPPRGGVVRWKPGHDFGTWKPASTPLGGPNSRYARSYAGGPGGFMRLTPLTASVGSTLPGAAAHRGGSGFRASPNLVTLIRGGERMRQALGHKFNAWIKRETARAGLKLGARPHATDNPKLKMRIARITRVYVARNRVLGAA